MEVASHLSLRSDVEAAIGTCRPALYASPSRSLPQRDRYRGFPSSAPYSEGGLIGIRRHWPGPARGAIKVQPSAAAHDVCSIPVELGQHVRLNDGEPAKTTSGISKKGPEVSKV